MELIEGLEKARALISEEARWMKGALGRTALETISDEDELLDARADGTIECLCAEGACYVAATYPDLGERMVEELQSTLKLEGQDDRVFIYNDAVDTTHDEVLGVFDRTIARLKRTRAS